MEHETLWNSSTAGGTQTPGHCVTSGWQDLPIRGRDSERVHKLGSALGPGLSQGWSSRASAQTDAWPTAPAVPVSEAQAPRTPGARSWGGGIYHGSLDPATDLQADRETFRSSVSPRPCGAGDDGSKMDMAEAGAPCHTKRRAGHRTLEEASVAGDKKKPKDLGPIWYSSTKADSSLFLTSARPGHRWAVPPFSDTATGGSGFLPSPPSLSPHRESGLDFTFASIPLTSREWRSSAFCATSSGICAHRLCCCGMVAPSTGAQSSRNSSATTAGSMRIGSRPTPQNLTRMSLYGPKPKTLWPMVRPKMLSSLAADCTALCIASETPSNSFGPAFTLQSSHGPD